MENSSNGPDQSSKNRKSKNINIYFSKTRKRVKAKPTIFIKDESGTVFNTPSKPSSKIRPAMALNFNHAPRRPLKTPLRYPTSLRMRQQCQKGICPSLRLAKGKVNKMPLLGTEKSKRNFYDKFMNFKQIDIQNQLQKLDEERIKLSQQSRQSRKSRNQGRNHHLNGVKSYEDNINVGKYKGALNSQIRSTDLLLPDVPAPRHVQSPKGHISSLIKEGSTTKNPQNTSIYNIFRRSKHKLYELDQERSKGLAKEPERNPNRIKIDKHSLFEKFKKNQKRFDK